MRVRLFTVAVVACLGLLPATASAVHVQCGDTITQDTTLDSDVVCTDQNSVGLVIGGDDLTLQLNGYTLQGADVANSDGIADDGTARSGIAIRGSLTGTIEGFEDGVDLDAANSKVMKLGVTATGYGVAIRGDGNYIYRVTVDMSAGSGIAGIEALGNGLFLGANQILGSPLTSPDDGIVVYGDNPEIIYNNVTGCAFDGVVAGTYTAGMIARNTVTGCDIGFTPSGTGIKIQTNNASGNCIGMVVDDPAAFVRYNDAHNNCAEGILILQAGATVKRNRANNNADHGINAAVGTIDLGENVAGGNGVANCLNLVCAAPPPD